MVALTGMLFNKKLICVFCASVTGASTAYLQGAADLGKLIADRRHGLLYGGSTVGAMGAVADATLLAGGEVVGVILDVMKEHGVHHRGLTELHSVQTTYERTSLLISRADAFAVLPGGCGTLDELIS